MNDAIDRLRELKRQGAALTPLQAVVLDAFYTHDPLALEAAEELDWMTKVVEAAQKLIDESSWDYPVRYPNGDYDIDGYLLNGLAAALEEQK